MNRTVAALFAHHAAAEEARRALLDGGIAPDRVRITPLEAPARSPGAALAEGFARALADLGIGRARAPEPGAGEQVLVVEPGGDTGDVLAILETCAPLAVDRAADRWADPAGAALEAAAGLTGQTSGAGTGTVAASLNNAASGLTPGRAAAPGPTSGVGPSVGTTTGLDGLGLAAVTPDDGLGAADPRRDAEIAARRNRLARD
ncbi:hypothetical protein [Salinarimonas soli]|uniref:Uncharacterized protein n=1 Tax=Salinarimonas soli TaxID=1638099 RepID=A0A5B2V9V4_9HYPH|nr:hypothetical protein [Salinarimonas soli]KAA2235017.1 hypothetical protein F0L46_22025 [Salinarimonas soli]